MAERRARTPNERAARRIAGSLFEDLDNLEWIPSDDADVFRLNLTSGRRPRILKMAIPGIRAVWREVAAFPAMRRLGVPEMLEFELTSDDRPDFGVAFHVTRELANPERASQAMADLWANQQGRALEVAVWLGDSTRRIESLDWRRVPRANSPERSIAIGAEWWQPQYARLLARSDCPTWARTVLDRLGDESSRPPEAFGGWGGELLQSPSGEFVPIDWPGLGAAPRGSLAAAALEVLLRFRAADPAPLVQRFLDGWRPDGLDDGGIGDLRLWWAHNILWWAGWNLGHDSDPDLDLAEVYAQVWNCLDTDDPVSWLCRARNPVRLSGATAY
jgi:hypothetical protein